MYVVHEPFSLRDGSFYFGTAPWYFLSRCTCPQTSSNELNNPVRLFADIFVQSCRREIGTSDVAHVRTFRARSPRRENCESARGDSGRAPHAISLMTRPPGNSFGPLALLDVYAGGTDTVAKVPVVRFDIDLYYMADEHEALGLGLSCTCHGAFCTENEVHHFHNVFFKIGKDEARLMSLSRRVLLETGYEALQRPGLIRASVGIAFQAEFSSNPSSTFLSFVGYICHLWHHYS